MVKNRALKRDARAIKASTGITYPRARDLLTDPVDQDTLVPSLSLGYGPDGGNIIHRPGKGTVLVISGGTGTGKSVLMNRLAAEASDVASIYIIDVAKQGSDYRDIRRELSGLETTAAGALARMRDLTETRHTASILFIDYIDTSEDIPGFTEALRALSDSGMPVIVGGQLPNRALPAAMMERADRILIGRTSRLDRQRMLRHPDAPVLGDRYKAVYETAAGSVEVILPPGGRVPEPDYSFTIGKDIAGAPVTFTPARDRSLLVTGLTGAGKTTFLNALAADAATSMDVYFSNAAFPSKEIRTPEAVRALRTHQETADMLDGIVQEISARRRACHEANVGGIAELTDPRRPILVVLDEFDWLVNNVEYAWNSTPELKAQRIRCAVAVGKIAREGRMAGVSLVLSSQTADVLQLIPGSGDLKVSLSRLVLEGMSRARLVSAYLDDRALQAQWPDNRQGVYSPISGPGGLVDLVMP
jgi:hypothetical protein